MNVIAIHPDKVAVRLGLDDAFQVCYILCAYHLVSWVALPCALRRRVRASWRQYNFTWRPLSLLLFSSMCTIILTNIANIIFYCFLTLLLLLLFYVSPAD